MTWTRVRSFLWNCWFLSAPDPRVAAVRRLLLIGAAVVGPALATQLPRPAAAAWPTDPMVNMPVCTAAGSQFNPVVVEDGAGGVIISWADARSGKWDIYAQHVLASGVVDLAWPAGGQVLSARGTNDLLHPVIISDGAGGAIVAWPDARSGQWDIYAQRVLASGAVDPAWPLDGRALCTAPIAQSQATIVSDGMGGGIVTWRDERPGNSDIYAQRVLASGAVDPAWPVDGRALCNATNVQAYPSIVTDGAGGAIVAWQDGRSGIFRIYAQHVLASGAMDGAWPADGRALSTATSTQDQVTIVSDGTGSAIVSWRDFRSGNSDIYAQRVLASGAVDPAWPVDGRALCTAANDQDFPTITSDQAGGAIVTWRDIRSGNWDIYAQRVLASGVVDPAWPLDGRALCMAANDQSLPTITSDEAGGAIVAWQDSRSGSSDIYAQHVFANGAMDPAWPVDGRALCTAMYDQWDPTIIPDAAGGAIVTWYDYRNPQDSDVYAQRVLANGQLGGDVPTATLVSIASTDVRPDRIRLTWYSTGNPVREATVHRRTGDTGWEPLGLIAPDGSGYLLFEDDAVVAGTLYGYRLGFVDEGQEVFAGEVWVEAPNLQLALRGATPNPAVGGRLRVGFTLGGQGPARIDLIDVAGRVVRTAEVGAVGPGTHSLDLAGDSSLPPGVYFLRLSQGGREVRARVAVVR